MWILFDLNGTLLDPAVLLDPPELPIAALDEANMMAMITVIAGAETTFKPLFDAALRRHLERAGRDPDEAGQRDGVFAMRIPSPRRNDLSLDVKRAAPVGATQWQGVDR